MPEYVANYATILRTRTRIAFVGAGFDHHGSPPYYHAVNFGINDSSVESLVARALEIYGEDDDICYGCDQPESECACSIIYGERNDNHDTYESVVGCDDPGDRDGW